jgi:hypothetical protein
MGSLYRNPLYGLTINSIVVVGGSVLRSSIIYQRFCDMQQKSVTLRQLRVNRVDCYAMILTESGKWVVYVVY